MKIIADEGIPFIKDYFAGYGELILKPGRAISKADLKDADILLVRSITRVNAALLAGSRVKFVGSVTAGVDHLDVDWLNKSNIGWSVASGFNAPPVADYVVSIIAALKKQRLFSLPARAAVIGVGHVGRLVAEHLRLVGFDIILCDPLRAIHQSDFVSTSIDDIADVDLITIHVPLTHKINEFPTYHFIDKSFLQRQRKGCVILNASRGAVIDSEALLHFGKHLRWCFDVWEHEPNINKTILERTLIATPHIAGYSIQSKIRGIDMIYRELCDRQIILPRSIMLKNMPDQIIDFAGSKLFWEEIVLGIFNPHVMSEMMKQKLFDANHVDDGGKLFDQMRNEFNYRYEFAFTKVKDIFVAEKDVKLVEELGIKIF